MKNINKAVILAAGLGSRLKPITNEAPKCLIEVNGKPIIQHVFENLQKFGIDEVLVVVGYLGGILMERFGNRFENLNIMYRWNEIYDETNSMYSAWIARDYLEGGCLLIEGDVLFGDDFLDLIESAPDDQAVWMGDRFGAQSDGCMLTTGAQNRIVELRIVRERLPEYKGNYFKSTGVLKITPQFGRVFSKWLSDEVDNNNKNIYYDLVIAKHLEDAPIHIVYTGDSRWVEIDDALDLRIAEKKFQPRKYVILVMDGAADAKIPELNNQTPFEAARTPALDKLARGGATGIVQTLFPGLPLGSIVANMGILGYDPLRYYPNGRASFEAMSQNVFLDDHDIAFRCNIIALDEDERIRDFTAGMIPDEDALQIINTLEIDNPDIELYSGQSYRNILILRNAPCLAKQLTAWEPHMNFGVPIRDKMVSGNSEDAERVAQTLNSFMLRSIGQIRKVNTKSGLKNGMLWLWSPSNPVRLPSFTLKYGLRGAVVAGLDFVRGIGMAGGMENKEIHGATGYLNTNMKEKLKYAKNFLHYNDLVFIHVNAPDEEAHAHHAGNKVLAIERIDNEILAPLVEYMDRNYPNNYRIAVLPDHYTYLSDGRHGDKDVPFLIYGDGVKPDGVDQFSEKAVESVSKGTMRSHRLMEMMLGKSL